MMAPNAMSVAQVSRDTGVSEPTLYNWQNRFRNEGKAAPAVGHRAIDNACLGGERNGGKPRRDSEHKQAFVIAGETDDQRERPRNVLF